ncbi:hypothetical protein C5L38_12885 [Streptomyces sp. WAC00288]|uniref:DUF7848 domain-containing protein n=1 Tax=Streptomyces sp. WAC00288 TaxID=2094021 RepID=UPI0007873EB1|nr:hypothetical protein C5L38_12885 [Streptomyces sp. WAC00288]KYG54522.1 hypothetical protein AWI43_08700 [Streptomyces sp. WAC04657]
MSVKAVLRFVEHRITTHPDAESGYSARCLNPDCRWSIAPTADGKQADVDVIEHSAATGHRIFSRVYEAMAVVVPVEQTSAPGR